MNGTKRAGGEWYEEGGEWYEEGGGLNGSRGKMVRGDFNPRTYV